MKTRCQGWMLAAAALCSLAGVSFGQVSENFDATSLGSLPASWSTTGTGAGAPWSVVNTQSHSAPNAVFTTDVPSVSTQYLMLPVITANGPVRLDLWSYFYCEPTYDGWTIEVDYNGGGFNNIQPTSANPSPWILNGYNQAAMNANTGSPIGGQPAFSGNFQAWTEHTALISANTGDQVTIRINMSCDESVSYNGVWLDDITVTSASNFGACCAGAAACTPNSASGCAASGGVFFGAGTGCSPTPCPSGACCSGGGCSLSFAQGCTGTFVAGGSCTASYPAPTQTSDVLEDISTAGPNPGTPWVEGGNAGIFSLDDGNNLGIPIGFTFNFYGQPQTSINVCTNGVAYFGVADASGYPAPAAIPTAANTPLNSIAPNWQDLILTSADQITYTTLGTAPYRRFIVQWNNVARYPNTGEGFVTFEIILYETADAIAFRYGNLDPGVPTTGPNLIVGVENSDATDATSVDPTTLGGGSTALVWQVGGNSCANSTPTGACCAGGGCSAISYGACLASSGAFQGNATTCTSAPCLSGACCGIAGGCTLAVQSICTSASGVFQGVGHACGATACPTGGSCCNGTSCALAFQANCSGQFTASGSCSPNNCGGACCDAVAGTCSFATQDSCSGNFSGPGTACTGVVCNGACCDNNSGNCTLTGSSGCFTGTYQGDGSACSAFLCGQGACCNDSTAACTITAQPGCFSGSTFQGAGTTCFPNNCPTQACCDPTTGLCTTTGIAGTCAGNTTSQGPGSTCSPNPCPQPPTGACCQPATQTCTEVFGSTCANSGGSYQGDFTTCASSACPFGACCIGCTGCVTTTSGDCAAQSGTYSGDGSTCDPSQGCPIINGGFESSTFGPGWTQFGDMSFTEVFMGDFDNFVAHGGGYFAFFGPTAGVGGIMQTIPAHAGDQVTIGFWYGVVAETPNSFEADFDGQTLVSFVDDVTNTTWTQFTFPVTVSADNPTLMFSFTNPPAYGFLDDVTVCIQSSTGSGVCCRGSTCNTTVAQAACTTSGGTAGAHFVSSVSACNSAVLSNTPCCYADYNKVNGVSVQDIFDFLNDWFAGSVYAKVGGDGAVGGLSVQNIFDFLNNWFAGGCS